MKNKLRPYFSFTKKERTGIVVLSCICLLFIFFPYFFPAKELQLSDLTLSSGLQLLKTEDKQPGLVAERSSSTASFVLFPFNPNTLDAAGWMRLGLQERLVQRILNYRNKGGRFYKPTDLKKIWGMDPEKADQLIPYVELPESAIKKTTGKPVIAAIDINLANLEEWKTLPGIGETLSNRILKYRNQTGGFARVEELQQVFGLTDSTWRLIMPYLKLLPATVPKLMLNRASAHQLVQKTGIPLSLAQAIVKKRLETGNYTSWTELEELSGMTPEMLAYLQMAFKLE